MGVYSSYSITKYINFYDIIKEIRAKYPTPREKINQEHIGRAFLMFMQKKNYCYLVVFVLTDLVLLNWL